MVQPEPAPEQLQVDMGHVRAHHGQQQVLLLVDENEMVDEDQTTYRIQYTEPPPQPPPPQPPQEQIITQEMGRKVEMIKAARTQKRLAKLQQQSMKQQNRTKTAPRQFVDKKQKINKVKNFSIFRK